MHLALCALVPSGIRLLIVLYHSPDTRHAWPPRGVPVYDWVRPPWLRHGAAVYAPVRCGKACRVHLRRSILPFFPMSHHSSTQHVASERVRKGRGPGWLFLGPSPLLLHTAFHSASTGHSNGLHACTPRSNGRRVATPLLPLCDSQSCLLMVGGVIPMARRVAGSLPPAGVVHASTPFLCSSLKVGGRWYFSGPQCHEMPDTPTSPKRGGVLKVCWIRFPCMCTEWTAQPTHDFGPSPHRILDFWCARKCTCSRLDDPSRGWHTAAHSRAVALADDSKCESEVGARACVYM